MLLACICSLHITAFLPCHGVVVVQDRSWTEEWHGVSRLRTICCKPVPEKLHVQAGPFIVHLQIVAMNSTSNKNRINPSCYCTCAQQSEDLQSPDASTMLSEISIVNAFGA